MESKNKELIEHGLRWGLMLALITITIQMGSYLVNKELLVSMWAGIFYLLITIVLMVLPILQQRKEQNGLISFKEAFLIAFIVSVSSSLITQVYTYVLYNLIDIELAGFIKEKAVESAASMMEKFNTPQEEIEKQLEKMQEQDFSQTPGTIAKQFLWGTIVGAIIASIIAAILKKQPKTDDTVL